MNKKETIDYIIEVPEWHKKTGEEYLKSKVWEQRCEYANERYRGYNLCQTSTSFSITRASSMSTFTSWRD